MRSPRRRSNRRVIRRVPAASRVTVPRTVAALRRSREALVSIEDQLDALLRAVRVPSTLDPTTPDDLHRAVGEAERALLSLRGRE